MDKQETMLELVKDLNYDEAYELIHKTVPYEKRVVLVYVNDTHYTHCLVVYQEIKMYGFGRLEDFVVEPTGLIEMEVRRKYDLEMQVKILKQNGYIDIDEA